MADNGNNFRFRNTWATAIPKPPVATLAEAERVFGRSAPLTEGKLAQLKSEACRGI